MSKKDKRNDDIRPEEIIEETIEELEELDETDNDPEEFDEGNADESEADDLDEDDLDDDEEPVKRKKGGCWKKVLLVLSIILIVLIGVYLGVAFYFNSHFMFQTKINGVDFSLKSVSEVEKYMEKQVADYSLTLEESDGTQEIVKGTDISIEYVPGNEISQMAESQSKFLWVKSLWETTDIEAKIGVKYDDSKLTEVLQNLDCMDEEKQTASKSAYPAFQDTKFEIVPEVVGTEVDEEKFIAAVSKAVNGFQETLDLIDTDCYILPKYVSDSPEVIKAADKMNSYIEAKITYEFGSETEVVDAAQIAKWLKVNKSKMSVSFDEDGVKEYIKSLAEKYDTKYKAKKFTTATGDTVTVEGGSYGWQIDQDEECDQLISEIKKGKVVTREPKYSSKAASHDGAGVGDTYAEVDLTGQKMYFIKDGKVVLESDIVTGNPNNGNATPQGIYTLSYKTKNAVLRGEKLPDGSYSYESPVKYWMPFNGGIGFHDASWQSSFGGDRYKSHGSHGCVNMPEEKAAKLYDLISAGTPVVCHY